MNADSPAEPAALERLRAAVAEHRFAGEEGFVDALLSDARFSAAARERIADDAAGLVARVRATAHPVDSLLHEYSLSSEEGVLLMCLAEGLLRIPDATTADRLIRDKLAGAQWDRHLGHSRSLLVNASTWGLMLTGRFTTLTPGLEERPSGVLARLVGRSGEPTVRAALKRAMHLLARQFVMGRSVEEALRLAGDRPHYRYSFDMLGEAAVGAGDAERFLDAYRHAIHTLGQAGHRDRPLAERPGISVKLSALHPRYEYAQRGRVMRELLPRLTALAVQARQARVPVTIDAEEADRLELSLDLFEAAIADPALAGWSGLGLALQAYQKRAPAVLDWLAALASRHRRLIPVRLVKGAYWDTEIKRAQQQGLPGYPVYTRKLNTDIAYLACARRLLSHEGRLIPQFATHNAHTVAAVREMADGRGDFEYQRLHGMGAGLYQTVVGGWGLPCRVYAPVGGHRELLPYLVRRLLENGANSSFVNRIVDRDTPVAALVADPAEERLHFPSRGRPKVPLPADIYPDRRNSAGIVLDEAAAVGRLLSEVGEAGSREWAATPRPDQSPDGRQEAVASPADPGRRIGQVRSANARDAALAMQAAADAWPGWERRPVADRAAILDRAAELIEARRSELMALLAFEGGRTLPDGLAEVREAADFCRYYAALARRELAPRELAGPTGERNVLSFEGRGPFLCISPWNFPVAIFCGQIAAALVAGNTVVAKPAHQTPLCGMRMVELLYEAGVPEEALAFLPGPSGAVGEPLLNSPHLAGVVFTGSTETAARLRRTLAARPGPIVPLVAETGGMNALIADSSALAEQVVLDAVRSAFNSAGQRCSALRLLFVQEEAAERLIELLSGAMAELTLGEPWRLETDIGPVIDRAAQETLERHIERIGRKGRLLYRCPLPEGCRKGTFFAPALVELEELSALEGEVFGPVLHLLRYRADRLDSVIGAINGTGYGLTLGIHTRVEAVADHIARRVRVGNVYVNRDMVGAVVGVQPFGGRGLSGTGPKAGGPSYLHRFVTEKVVSTNTAAVGGNAALLGRD